MGPHGDLAQITVPTLVIGAEHDTMDPAHLRWMSRQLPTAAISTALTAATWPSYDDQETYFEGLLQFLQDVDARA